MTADLVCKHCGNPIWRNGPIWSHDNVTQSIECLPNYAEPEGDSDD